MNISNIHVYTTKPSISGIHPKPEKTLWCPKIPQKHNNLWRPFGLREPLRGSKWGYHCFRSKTRKTTKIH